MNWDALGAIGEIVGALAVFMTLLILLVQMRQSTKAMEESNRLERVAAIDRHAETVAMWRGKLIADKELAEIWLKVSRDETLTESELIRANFLWIEFMNTQRSNFVRSMTVGEEGLTRQSVLSLASHVHLSRTFALLWEEGRVWTQLASEDFVDRVDQELEKMTEEGNRGYNPFPLINRLQPDGTLK